MKGFVADLSEMVGGQIALATVSARTIRRQKAGDHARQAPKKTPAIAKRLARGRAPARRWSKEVYPDDIIPMDESDFKEF
ncbi:MAG: hypothetical protein HY881_03980 [Deltaproteobacteria bacterium]|nr:hypothetical protein [Deltaproteobacteria bacterium]